MDKNILKNLRLGRFAVILNELYEANGLKTGQIWRKTNYFYKNNDVLDVLKDKGLIDWNTPKNDSRAKVWSITSKGVQFMSEINKLIYN